MQKRMVKNVANDFDFISNKFILHHFYIFITNYNQNIHFIFNYHYNVFLVPWKEYLDLITSLDWFIGLTALSFLKLVSFLT